jgi:hypothetical protein
MRNALSHGQWAPTRLRATKFSCPKRPASPCASALLAPHLSCSISRWTCHSSLMVVAFAFLRCMSQPRLRGRVIAQPRTRPRSVAHCKQRWNSAKLRRMNNPSCVRNTFTLAAPHPGGTSGMESMDTLRENLLARLRLQHNLGAKAFLRLLTILSADHLL